jgi:hypothetical protein
VRLSDDNKVMVTRRLNFFDVFSQLFLASTACSGQQAVAVKHLNQVSVNKIDAIPTKDGVNIP